AEQNKFATVFPYRPGRIQGHAFRREFSQEFTRCAQPKNPARKKCERERKHQPDDQTAVNQMTIHDELFCPDQQPGISGPESKNARGESAVKPSDVITFIV